MYHPVWVVDDVVAWIAVCVMKVYHDREYHQTSNISHPLVGNKIVDHSDVVGAMPVSAAPTTSSFLS